MYLWHVVLNCAFSSFVVGMPLAWLPRRLDPARRLPHRVGTWFWGTLVWKLVPFWRLEVEGRDNLRGGPFLLCANHQSMLDVLVLMALRGDYKWVSGARFFQIPMLAAYMRATGYIEADLTNPFSATPILEACGQCLDQGVSVGMFPEGTRSPDGRLGSFKPGAFRVSVERGIPVVPVAIDGTREILPRGSWALGARQPFQTIRLRVLPPIYPADLPDKSPQAMAAACKDAIAATLSGWRAASGLNAAGGDVGAGRLARTAAST